MINFKKDTSGFTIIELMIATSVFSVVLLLCATAIVEVGRTYSRGLISNRTQNISRQVSDDIAQSIQFGARSTTFDVTGPNVTLSGVETRVRCFGEVRYTYTVNRSLGTDNLTNQSRHVLWKDRITIGSPCVALDLTLTVPSANGTELLGANMRIVELTAIDTGGLWRIKTIVAYGEEPDMFVTGSNFTQCESFRNGGQFCVISTINTNVVKRL